MKKAITIIMLLMTAVANGQTTYIPTYRSYLHIITTDGDTLAVANNLDTLVLGDPGKMFALRLDHEDVTKEKVKAIKRAKRRSGWATFSAVMSGISTAFSDNSLEYYIRRENTKIATDIAVFYATEAKEEQSLDIDLWLDNLTDKEMMVSDMERGLVWWILPKQTMQLRLNNPELARLRISDAQSSYVRYASALAGNWMTKYEIALDTNEYWYSPVYMKDKPHETSTILHYIRINKKDYKEEKLKKEEFWEIRKSVKKAAKK